MGSALQRGCLAGSLGPPSLAFPTVFPHSVLLYGGCGRAKLALFCPTLSPGQSQQNVKHAVVRESRLPSILHLTIPVCNCRCGCCKPHAATPPPAAAALPARLSEADEVHAQAASTAHGHDFGSYGKSLAAMRKMSPDAAAQAMEVRLRSVQKNFL